MTKTRARFLRTIWSIWFVVLSIAGADVARADWVNLTGAEVAPNIAAIYIEDEGVRVELEVYIGDLKSFLTLIRTRCWRKSSARSPRQNASGCGCSPSAA